MIYGIAENPRPTGKCVKLRIKKRKRKTMKRTKQIDKIFKKGNRKKKDHAIWSLRR